MPKSPTFFPLYFVQAKTKIGGNYMWSGCTSATSFDLALKNIAWYRVNFPSRTFRIQSTIPEVLVDA